MAKNREMLKEAIAEAKAVKEMAIANAKAALEEAFTPQLKSMLSLKLQEMELEEEDLEEYTEYQEDPETGRPVTSKDVYGTEEKMMEVDLEELLAELELEEEEEPLYEAEEDEDEEEDEATEDVDLSDEEIKDMIEDVLAQMIKDGEIEAGPNFEAEEGEEEASEEDEEEVNLEELLKEIEEMEKDEYYTNEIFDPSAPIVLSAGLGALSGLIALGTAYYFSRGAVKKEELEKRITNLVLSKQKGTLDKEWETMKKDMEKNPQLKQKVLDNLDLIQKMGLSLDEAETGNPMLDALKSVAADQNISLSSIVKGSEKVEDTVEKIEEMEEKEMETESLETGIPSEAEVKAAADKIAAAVKSGEIDLSDFQAFLQAGREEAKDDIATLNEAEGEPSKEEIKTMLKDDIKDLQRKKSVWKIATALGISLASAGLVTLGLGFIVDAAAVNAAKAFEVIGMAPEVLIGVGGLASGAAAGIASANKVYQANLGIASKEYQLKKMDKELTEAYSTIKSLRSELNEINLLNAKLLYTNKIFKAKNLNENQKVKVLSSFDKAKNVGEVKMVYETLNEGIKVAKTTIKENLGRASKSTVTPTAKQPIVESNDVFKRMQKLAGLI
jgi:hypothetical protein